MNIKELLNDNNISFREDNHGRLYVKINNKTRGYMTVRKDGKVSWRAKFDGINRETHRFDNAEEIVATIDELKKQKTNLKVIPRTPSPVKVKADYEYNYTDNDKKLIPEMFAYHERTDRLNNIHTLERALADGENVLLEGPTGTGKTTMVRFYCAKHKLPYKRVSLNGGATADDLVGHYILESNGDGNVKTIWIDGVLGQAMVNGWVLVIDEINGAPAEILFVLNSVLDKERILVLSQKDGQIIKPHKNFRVVATCNPTEQGYAGTNEINEALRDRFETTLKVDYNESVENKILKEIGIDTETRKDIMEFTKFVRESYAKSEIITPFSTRSVMNLAKFVNQGVPDLILNRFRDSERAVISDLLDVFIHKRKTIETILNDMS